MNSKTSQNTFSFRWDSSTTPTGIAKLNFPIDSIAEEQSDDLVKLIQDCWLASLSYKGEDAYDKSYCKASKMDRSVFAVEVEQHNDEDESPEQGCHYVGRCLEETVLTNTCDFDCDYFEELPGEFGGKWLKVNWLTQPVSKNVGFVHWTVSITALSMKIKLFMHCTVR